MSELKWKRCEKKTKLKKNERTSENRLIFYNIIILSGYNNNLYNTKYEYKFYLSIMDIELYIIIIQNVL